jgi:membrane protease YdiL (CAAX protease family)
MFVILARAMSALLPSGLARMDGFRLVPIAICSALALLALPLALRSEWRQEGLWRYIGSKGSFLWASASLLLGAVLLSAAFADLLQSVGLASLALSPRTGNIWLELAVIGIMHPVMEDLVFRGVATVRLRTFMRAGTAILLSSIINALFYSGPSYMLFGFIKALVLAYVFVCARNIWLPMIINCASCVLFVLLSHASSLSRLLSSTGAPWLFPASIGLGLVLVVPSYLYVRKKRIPVLRLPDMDFGSGKSLDV